MPYADSRATVDEWAHGRAVSLWALFAGDVPQENLPALELAFDAIREDGGRVALIVGQGSEASATERGIVDLVVAGAAAPTPFGLLAALQEASVADVRRLGVIGARKAALEAGHRAGAGAIVGLAPAGSEGRAALVEAEPDVIIEAGELAGLDRERYGSARPHRERLLLNPGPAVVSDRVHRAIGGPDLCHREPEYTDLFARVRAKLLRIAGVGDDWALVVLAGSGTAAMEAMAGGAVRPGRSILVCRNGIYGERIETMARRLGLEVVTVSASHFEPVDPAEVEAALAAHPEIDAVAVIHHETTTGLLNPVEAIAAVAQRHGAVVLVDAISSFGAEDLNLDGTGIDFLASTSNKCLHGLPGAAFVLVSPRGQERIAQVPPRSVYFDMGNYLKYQAKSSVPFTPSIPAMYGLEAAIDELEDEGPARRKQAYAERVAYLDRELGRMGFEAQVAPAHRSRSVRSFRLPPGVQYDTLHDAVKAEGYIIYAGLGDAAATSFRVCTLGAMNVEALEGFVQALERALGAVPVAV